MHTVAQAGIARTFQNIRLFGDMTALENVMVGRHVRTRSGVWGAVFKTRFERAEEQAIRARALELLAFAMGASFGGVSGAMFASFQGFVSPESFVLSESIVIVAMVVLGGMGHIPGVILGAILLYAIPEVLRYAAKPAQEALFGTEIVAPEALRMLVFGLAMVLIMLRRPEGLWPAPRHGKA